MSNFSLFPASSYLIDSFSVYIVLCHLLSLLLAAKYPIFLGYKCSRFSRIEPVPQKFIPTKIYNSRRVQYYGFEANSGVVQLHVDVRMRQKAGTQTTKIKSAKSFVMVHPRKFIPSKYTRYTVLAECFARNSS